VPGTSKSGRKPKPLRLKLLTGGRVRQRDRRVADVPPALPNCPAGVQADDKARAHWEALTTRLGPLRLLRATDGEALAMLCFALADADRLREEFQRTQCRGLLVERLERSDGTVRTRPRLNPLLRAISDNSRLVRQWLSEFGLTPATLEQVPPAPAPTPADPLEALLKA
jgi:P27 family predicted phage terminase small subunit